MKQCNTLKKKVSYKTCKNKNMGGQSYKFIDLESTNCGKLYNKREYKNYKYITSFEKYKPFIPKLYGLCDYNNKDYMIIENLFSSFKDKSKIKFLDIKLGYYTSSYLESKSYIKDFRHKILDIYKKSIKLGFRVEGGNTSFKNFFKYEKVNKKIINKLIKLLNLLLNEKSWSIIGTSVFLIHDNNKILVKLIDFDHVVKRDNNNKKLLKNLSLNITLGLTNLIENIKYN